MSCFVARCTPDGIGENLNWKGPLEVEIRTIELNVERRMVADEGKVREV